MENIKCEDLGLINFKDAWDYQIKLFNELTLAKNTNQPGERHYILFCEHPHVFTIGKSGDSGNLLISSQLMAENGIEYYHIDRGGDITYHGPGQQVVYPILDLDKFRINTKEYVRRLEEAVINTLESFSIMAGRLEGAAGIWLDQGIQGKCRKICAIGVKSSQRITMHGLALNINSDLSYFKMINPCGFIDKGVTSMKQELGYEVDFKSVQQVLKENILVQFKNDK